MLSLLTVDSRAQDGEPAPLPRPTVTINVADNATLAHLDRFHALLAERQWQEAIETIRQVTETSGEQLVLVTHSDDIQSTRFRRYLSIAAFAQLQVSELARHAPEALTLYRQQIDPVASRLFASAGEPGDEAVLQKPGDQVLREQLLG